VYDSTAGFTLQFFGDDDLFVYINGILVSRLGRRSPAVAGKVAVTGAPGAQTGDHHGRWLSRRGWEHRHNPGQLRSSGCAPAGPQLPFHRMTTAPDTSTSTWRTARSTSLPSSGPTGTRPSRTTSSRSVASPPKCRTAFPTAATGSWRRTRNATAAMELCPSPRLPGAKQRHHLRRLYDPVQVRALLRRWRGERPRTVRPGLEERLGPHKQRLHLRMYGASLLRRRQRRHEPRRRMRFGCAERRETGTPDGKPIGRRALWIAPPIAGFQEDSESSGRRQQFRWLTACHSREM